MNLVGMFKNLLNSLKTSPLGIFTILPRLEILLEEITMNQEELLAKLKALQDTQDQTKSTLDKVMGEVGVLITALANTNNDLSPAVADAVNKLIATSSTVLSTAQALDTMNPDEPVEPITEETGTIEDLSGASPS
jgi:uncharacterized protein YoxC